MAIRQASKSLSTRQHPLSDTMIQLEILNHQNQHVSDLPDFKDSLAHHGHFPLRPASLEVLQVNIGKKCNQSCAHCHVDAGPDRTEQMSRPHLERCLDIIDAHKITTVDITGGAPELNPNFQWFVEECSKRKCHVIDRCNLTIIVSNSRFHSLPDFFAKNNVHLICSLPHFNRLRTDHQRGEGVFNDSIKALKMLNERGYGLPGSGLLLDLVHNPSGAFLPGDQASLEAEFKRQLKRQYEIEFNHLFCITNLPVSRYLEYLVDSGNLEQYMQALIESFNPATIQHLMCRNTT